MSEPRPQDVPGFAEAAAAGLLPRVPAGPPSLVPGRTAEALFRLFLIKLAAAVLLYVLALRWIPGSGLPGPWPDVVLLAAGLLLVLLAVRWWRPIGRRNVEELRHGYTTVTLQIGGAGWSDGRYRRGEGRLTSWDYSGIWVLDGSGRVRSAPDPAVPPPGFYPSPTRPPDFELWTGAAWAGQYRRPPASADTAG